MILGPYVFGDEHLPQRLLHRDRSVGVLNRAVEPALEGDRPDDVVLHGPPGVGKSVLARHTLESLEGDYGLRWVRVEAMSKTTAGIIRSILQDLGADVARTTPQEDLCLQLRERANAPLVVVLDEANDLAGTDALPRLTDVPEIGVVPIVHQLDRFLSKVDPSVRRRLQGAGHGLDSYGVDELADILEPRVRKGLEADVERAHLEQVADRAAGHARTGIQMLRAGADVARDQGCAIEAVDVDDAYDLAQRRIRKLNLESMDVHHHVVYGLIREAGRIPPGELHDRYSSIAEEVYEQTTLTPIGRRSRQYKLDNLEEYDLIATVESRFDHYEPRDPEVVSERVDLSEVRSAQPRDL